MNYTNIDKPSSFQLSNDEIFQSLKYLFFVNKENYGIEKFIAIAELIRLITSKSLLDNTIRLVKENGYSLHDTEPYLQNIINSGKYTEADVMSFNFHIY